jgi:hypothetical protein
MELKAHFLLHAMSIDMYTFWSDSHSLPLWRNGINDMKVSCLSIQEIIIERQYNVV